ncbi:PAS domain S-box protein [Kineosporia sp. J2-2]|uniref:Sensor-like histidine kinase SenX3 n=1 Tax=Kineosporia corallincola TaxID=2835133 RepID=A0ABS5TJY8_9ACTN|nr:PAS domain S-box protein [Kineosporia corallincola]MBT0770516.1 PAS domain S-box protein [Kineosporia corallincola]
MSSTYQAPAALASSIAAGFVPPVTDGSALIDLLWGASEASMAVIGSDRVLHHANPAAAAALGRFGVSVGEVVPRYARVHPVNAGPDGRPAVDETTELTPVEDVLGGAGFTRALVNVVYGDGNPARRMLLSGQPIRLEDDEPGALMIWTDVTDSWQFAERSRNELDRLGQLLEGASDYAIIMLDACGKVHSWSAAAERIQGYSSDEAIGLPYASFFDAADQHAGLPARILADAAAQGKINVEGKRVRHDGSVFWAHASISAMRDEQGRLQGYVKVTHDVSEQRALQQASQELTELLESRVAERTVQLEQKAADLAAVNAELEAFSYSVSHDLRAPLRAMSGFARIMSEEYGSQMPPEALKYLTKVTENAEHMGSLIDALLAFSRMQRQEMQSRPIDMTTLAQDCWNALEPAREGRDIEFVLAPLPPAFGDGRLIQQVWMNLLDNAIKYTGKKDAARVEVRAEVAEEDEAPQPGPDPLKVPDTVMYLVKDNGAGFDMRYAAKLGQVFQRLHHHEEFAGTGIGLALSQRIVQRHGGQLSAVGEPGVGATMGFTLPVPNGELR